MLVVSIFGVYGLFGHDSHAQAKPGRYTIISLGTAGGHAQDPGSKGTMTVFSDGRIQGSGYSYDDGTTSNFTGRVNLATGRGTVTDGTYTIDFTSRASTKTFIDMNYTKRGSSSKGIIWGVR